MWRNGRRGALKMLCSQGRVGSSPTTGTDQTVVRTGTDQRPGLRKMGAFSVTTGTGKSTEEIFSAVTGEALAGVSSGLESRSLGVSESRRLGGSEARCRLRLMATPECEADPPRRRTRAVTLCSKTRSVGLIFSMRNVGIRMLFRLRRTGSPRSVMPISMRSCTVSGAWRPRIGTGRWASPGGCGSVSIRGPWTNGSTCD